MRRKFNGDTCCSCGSSCPLNCGCTIGSWFPNTNGPDQFLVSDIVVPSSYRLWSAEYVQPCPNDGCQTEFNPADPFAPGPLISVTPYNKIGYKTLGSFVLNKIGAAGTAFCGWAADVAGVPLATSKDDCWGLDALGAGVSLTDMCGGVTGGSDAAWAQNPVTATMNPGNLPTGCDWGSTEGLGNMYSGLRRVELLAEGLAINGDPCGRPTLRLFPAEVWSPLSSRRWEGQFGACPFIENQAVDGDESVGYAGAVPVNLRYWEEDSFQVDAWDSPNLRGFIPSFDIQFEIPATTTSAYYLFFGQDIHCDIEDPVSVDMAEGSAFNVVGGVSAGVCGNLDFEIQADAVVNTYTGVNKVGASLDTSRGEMCNCWSNPHNGGGCLPFPATGFQPDESNLVTNLVLVSGGTTYTQNGTSSWGGLGIATLVVPTDNGDVFLVHYAGNEVGRRIYVGIGSEGTDEYLLDSCGVGIVGSRTNGDTLNMDFPNGQDCDECNDNVLVTGCCEVNGQVQITAGEAACTALGGTYAGNDTTCPPTGCCALVGSPDLSDVSEAYCTAQGGSWTQDADCAGTGYCQDPVTGVVTEDVEENDCTGTWSATPFPTGCCAIAGSTDQSGKNQVECAALGGVWTEGAECGTGWCVDNTTGAITAGVEEDECSGTWSATEPVSGCCTISGTQNPDVAESWCTSQSGTFVAGDCPASSFDPCEETFSATANDITLDMNDPNFYLANPFYIWPSVWGQGGANNDHDACSANGVAFYPVTVSIHGDHTAGPTAANFFSYTYVKYNSGSSNWTVTTFVQWANLGTTYSITASKSGISLPSADCPSFTISGSYDTFSGNYTQSGNGQTFTVQDLIGSFNITLTCE